MDIILLQDVEKVGDKYTITTVKDGYARNYLIPQGMALIANETNRRRLNDFRNREAAMEEKMLSTYQEIAASIEGKTLRIGAKAGTSGKIFGSVTTIQLAQELQNQFGLEVDKKKIILPEEVKEIGTYKAVLNLHKKVQPEVTFELVAE
ncbi:MAG: 50S ribosomal protein L9 [Saprospiraceae bacterium]|nr:50S ribosomal protein L9 [Saprospiraceae bacterium]MCB9324548.1 50S ribosomal protein L9 [Lewinellaceae bacterium]